jgi:hypothetical protein
MAIFVELRNLTLNTPDHADLARLLCEAGHVHLLQLSFLHKDGTAFTAMAQQVWARRRVGGSLLCLARPSAAGVQELVGSMERFQVSV